MNKEPLVISQHYHLAQNVSPFAIFLSCHELTYVYHKTSCIIIIMDTPTTTTTIKTENREIRNYLSCFPFKSLKIYIYMHAGLLTHTPTDFVNNLHACWLRFFGTIILDLTNRTLHTYTTLHPSSTLVLVVNFDKICLLWSFILS